MIERIEERIRNMVNPFYNISQLLKDIDDQNVLDYIKENGKQMSNVMYMSIEYLIDMAKIIDKNLPKNFDRNVQHRARFIQTSFHRHVYFMSENNRFQIIRRRENPRISIRSNNKRNR